MVPSWRDDIAVSDTALVLSADWRTMFGGKSVEVKEFSRSATPQSASSKKSPPPAKFATLALGSPLNGSFGH